MTERDPGQNADRKNDDNMRAVYEQVCESYRAIDVFRGTLLGALPLVSGGTFLLIGTGVIGPNAGLLLFLPIGVFGALVTLGLFVFEIYATNRCTKLIKVGEDLERKLDIDGQFRSRPIGIEDFPLISQKLAPYVSEPLASGIIYPAVLGAWVFLALHKVPPPIAAGICGILVFVVFFSFSFAFNRWLTPHEKSQNSTEEGQGG